MVILDFRTIAMDWSSIGMFDLLLPMLLIFVVVYSVLQRTKVLGKQKEIDGIVALIISFFVIGNPEVSSFFLPLFSNVVLGIIIMLSFLLLVGFLGGRPGKAWQGITLWGGIAVFIWVMSRAADYFSGYNLIFSRIWWYTNSYWIIPLVLILIVIGAITSSESSAEEKRVKADMMKATFPWWFGHTENVD